MKKDFQQEAISFSYILHMMEVSGDKSKMNELETEDLFSLSEYLRHVRLMSLSAIHDRLLSFGHHNITSFSLQNIKSRIGFAWSVATLTGEESKDFLVIETNDIIPLSDAYNTTVGGGFHVFYPQEGGALVVESEKMKFGLRDLVSGSELVRLLK